MSTHSHCQLAHYTFQATRKCPIFLQSKVIGAHVTSLSTSIIILGLSFSRWRGERRGERELSAFIWNSFVPMANFWSAFLRPYISQNQNVFALTPLLTHNSKTAPHHSHREKKRRNFRRSIDKPLRRNLRRAAANWSHGEKREYRPAGADFATRSYTYTGDEIQEHASLSATNNFLSNTKMKWIEWWNFWIQH